MLASTFGSQALLHLLAFLSAIALSQSAVDNANDDAANAATNTTNAEASSFPWRQNCTLDDRISHEYFCDIYYQCVHHQSATRSYNHWQIEQCTDMYHYSGRLRKCEPFWMVGCNPRGDKPIVQPLVDCPRREEDFPKDGGQLYLPHANCSRYYRCDARSRGLAVELQCSAPLHWDRNRQLCMQPANAGCVASDAAVPQLVDPLPDVADARCPRGLADSWTVGGDAVECDRWWQCDRGVVQWKRCAGAELFDRCREECAPMAADRRCVGGHVERRNGSEGVWETECGEMAARMDVNIGVFD